MQQPKKFGELCPWCEGDGRVGLAQRGAGPHGLDCPYCYEYRGDYVVGQVPANVTTLPPERSRGMRWWTHLEQQMAASTAENTPLRRLYPPHHADGPIERPRRRTAPMHGAVGVVRHWTTHTLLPRFKTGPVTRQHRFNQQVEFVKAYPLLKADRRRRENAVFCLTIISWVIVSLCAVALLTFVIIAVLYHFMTP